ncbi:putative 3-demethylubiquinone-9 3-methyltransferase (glyoxalase superfamily) [Rhodopseudomonas thermotolerans]|uniref:3-demethylubiquinone-9 3-methyltransferase (Glyoxalase superfamily) n=2 Tax=Rhodopseudomonas TaxID=1073 RepID=A0A336K5A3_9BRAD|nr:MULTISPECIES: VOC family protein [Rhodopseudomonas]RED24195.1 putative 3-demethylubiquinone-9 3-methyltransferase (glyoxalase superfamily) [Rhodopseudomonas pentothenatexigens]REF90258.1 putative 3-demethylubiquinone-9 3-methyltransferase (glyoxalase superfamily) [Rhodopseudomonas thermotolerans]SSW93291.1 predicted 3-demethylubiquinone-9 3-methyltransferase (glyoxalase superfamily) [Rhodopseudomonas pentothenatexigens]
MSKIVPCLWFAGDAEQAAEFYVSLLPDSRIDNVQRSVVDTPGGPEGSVLVVEFTVAGQPFMALNGGTPLPFNHAVSFKIDCVDQAEVDRLWDRLLADGGEPVVCGWLRDRYGLSWQIVPAAALKLFAGPNREGAKRAMQAMMQMVKLDVGALQRAYEGA